jgi:hypothetical protein
MIASPSRDRAYPKLSRDRKGAVGAHVHSRPKD